MTDTGRQRCVRCLISICYFSPKSPIISGSFEEKDLQLKASYASLSPCIIHVSYVDLCVHICGCVGGLCVCAVCVC